MRKLCCIAVMACTLLLCSCQSNSEVQRRIVVHALGIDAGEKGFDVSYQVFSGKAPDGAPVDADESTVVTLTAQGRTLYGTEESLRLQTGKEVFLGDVELIVISDELKDEPLTEFLQYFRSSDIYLGVNVVYCKGKASDTIGVKLKQGSATAILLRGVVDEARKNGRALSPLIIGISNALELDDEMIAVPVLTLEKGEDKGEEYILTDTTLGVFDSQLVTKDGPKAVIDETAVMGITLLRAEAHELSIQAPTEQGIASVDIKNIRTERSVEISDGVPLVRLNISAQYEIRSFPIGSSEEDIRLSAQKELLNICVAGYGAIKYGDIFEIGKLLKKYKPEYVRSLGSGLEEVIPKTVFDVNVRLKKY